MVHFLHEEMNKTVVLPAPSSEHHREGLDIRITRFPLYLLAVETSCPPGGKLLLLTLHQGEQQ